MIPRECKRLAEVDFPIAEVSRHAVREKAIRHGHPNTLHLWWARRPLASSRAVLLALLLPDPCDARCPEEFKNEARRQLRVVGGDGGPTDEGLRNALLTFVGRFAEWDKASNPSFVEVGRALVSAANGAEMPVVVDPFGGGGSIPLEALRLGCEPFATDLNPVACLILKAILQDIPRSGAGFDEAWEVATNRVRSETAAALASYYPDDEDANPIAYLWARTIRCESPNCGCEIPLVRSFWLAKKRSHRVALRATVLREERSVRFEVFAPRNESEVQRGTIARAKATCLNCGTVLSPDRVRAQLAEQRGGADVIFDASGRRTGGAQLMAVVTTQTGVQGRRYRPARAGDYAPVWHAQNQVVALGARWAEGGGVGAAPIPDEPLPPIGTLGFRVQRYGMFSWGDLFTARQKLALSTLSSAIATGGENSDVSALLAMICTKLADRCNALVNWSVGVECPNQLFKGNAVPMAWDFAESNILSESSGSMAQTIENIARNVAATYIPRTAPGTSQQADASAHPLADQSCSVWFTDPPYYDAVPYSDLSDFFFVWFKRALPSNNTLADPFDTANNLTPKAREIVQDETKENNGRPKSRAWFEDTIAGAFAEGARVLQDDGIGCVVFAHKSTEGWEALLSGMIRGGWTITGSWPIATERAARMRARDSAALATSVHLVCRKRLDTAPIGDWGDVLRALPRRVADWMERLQSEGVRGADLVFACIGPALEIYSQFSRVETAEGREVPLGEYLEKVWEVVGRAALEHVLGTAEARARNGAAGALEEDARLTALFLWTVQSTAGAAPDDAGEQADDDADDDVEDEDEDEPAARPRGLTLVHDVARRFAQPLGIDLPKWERRIIETKKGVVRLLPVTERAKQLFGESGPGGIAAQLESGAPLGSNPLQGLLFPELDAPRVRGRGARQTGQAGAQSTGDLSVSAPEATTLDRVHAAMLLQRAGRTTALRALVLAEQERGPDFLRLANALSALYPVASEEKRLLDAMLLAAPR